MASRISGKELPEKNILEITAALLRAGAEANATTPAYGGTSTALALAATSYHPAKAGLQLELLQELLNAVPCTGHLLGVAAVACSGLLGLIIPV